MLPTPPDGLRHWRPDDAAALASAWSDPAITAWNPPPKGLNPEEWIAGAEARWSRRVALDLVIDAGGEVAGEVGLANFTSTPPRAELGVWIGAPYRRQGLARHAVDTVARWALAPLPTPTPTPTDSTPDPTDSTPDPNWRGDLPPGGRSRVPEPVGGLGLDQVWARADEGNEPAQRLFGSLGWQRLGTRDGIAIWAVTPAVLR